ncbi:MAG TPA: thiamine-phosphate kinase [Dongiaceae bacterium]
MTAKHRPTEFELIARYFAPLAAGAPGAASLGDDVALVSIGNGEELVLKTDAIVAGRHFTGEEPAGLIARKLLRVNLSDLAAKGARPIGYLLTAVFPRDIQESWIADFAAGLAEDQWHYGLQLLGGDTTSTTGPLTLSLTALGASARGRTPRRGDAKSGDAILVSGTIGDGALGLDAVRGRLAGLPPPLAQFLRDRYQLPEPRLAAGRALVESGIVQAAMDVSDGLVADLEHICQQSGLGAAIDWDRVPVSAAARAALDLQPDLRDRILGGGDDYELLITVADDDAPRAVEIAHGTGLALTVIGRMQPGAGVTVRAGDGSAIPLRQKGFQHF